MDSEKREIGYAEADYGGYDWGFARVYQDKGRFYIVRDSGCSCNGPKSSYGEGDACVGPAATLGGLLDELVVDSNKHDDLVKEALVNAVDNINKETIAAMRSALGLK